jgi:hypothetical protein
MQVVLFTPEKLVKNQGGRSLAQRLVVVATLGRLDPNEVALNMI